MSATDQRIRELAYQIWQSEGCPNGEDDRHWQMACRLAEAEQRSPEATPTATSPLPVDRLDDPPASDSSLLAEASDPAMTPPSDPVAKPRTPRTKASAAAPKASTAAEAGTPTTIKKPRAPRKKKET